MHSESPLLLWSVSCLLCSCNPWPATRTIRRTYPRLRPRRTIWTYDMPFLPKHSRHRPFTPDRAMALLCICMYPYRRRRRRSSAAPSKSCVCTSITYSVTLYMYSRLQTLHPDLERRSAWARSVMQGRPRRHNHILRAILVICKLSSRIQCASARFIHHTSSFRLFVFLCSLNLDSPNCQTLALNPWSKVPPWKFDSPSCYTVVRCFFASSLLHLIVAALPP